MYGHYDVQPVEPLGEWINGPFEPTIRDGNMPAEPPTTKVRSLLTSKVCDWLDTGSRYRCRSSFSEGEEEVGSLNLERMFRTAGETRL